jgi:putative membrane protein
VRQSKKLLPQAQVDQINQVLADTKRQTSVTILPVIANSSGRYDRAEDLLGLWAAALGLALTWALFARLPVGQEWQNGPGSGRSELVTVLGVVAAGFILGLLVGSRMGWLRRFFVPRRHMAARVSARAKQVFHEISAQFPDPDRSRLLLIYVSRYERQVAFVGGDAISREMSPTDESSIRRSITLGFTAHRLGQGLCAAIDTAARLLASRCPPEPRRTWSSDAHLRIIE